MNRTYDKIPVEMRRFFETLQDPLSLSILACLMKEHEKTSILAHMMNIPESDIEKHLNSLIETGLVIRWPVISPGEDEPELIWLYSTPASLIQSIMGECELIERDLSLVQNGLAEIAEQTMKKMKEYLGQPDSSLVILGGEGDGMVFELKYQTLSVGREDSQGMGGIEPNRDIIIPGSYRGVTRISKPHAIITRVYPDWYIEDCNSSGGTYLNNEMLKPFRRYRIRNQDIIVLGSGSRAARLRAHILHEHISPASDSKHMPVHSMGRA